MHTLYCTLCSLTVLVVHVGKVALAAVDAVKVSSHEDARAARGAHLAEALHLARVVHLVELEHAELHLLVLMLLLLGLGVGLLLTLLSTTQQPEGYIELRVVRDTAGSERSAVLKLATSKENALLISGDALTGLNGGLDIGHEGLGAELQDLGAVCKRGRTQR